MGTTTEPIPVLLPPQQRLLDQVQKALAEIDHGGSSRGILMSGPSGTGKTTAMDLVAKLPLPRGTGPQRCVPCCRIEAKARSDTSSVAQSILEELGKPAAVTRRLRGWELERQVHQALIACGVRILILEEFNNALLANTKHLRGQLAQFLKNLWNLHPVGDPSSWALPQPSRGDRRLVIIVSGTEEIRPVFDRDAELSSRFDIRINTTRLWFDSAKSCEQFARVFGSLVERFGLSEAIDASNASTLARSMFATQAHLRELESLLRRAATLHRAAGAELTGEALLAEALDDRRGPHEGRANPFRWSYEELKERVAAARNAPRHG